MLKIRSADVRTDAGFSTRSHRGISGVETGEFILALVAGPMPWNLPDGQGVFHRCSSPVGRADYAESGIMRSGVA